MVKNNKKGFTLIELLVVIAIIGLLATLAVVALGNARQKSRDAKRVSDIKQIQTALELRYVETDNYPAEFTDDAQSAACTGGTCALGREVTCLDNEGFEAGSCSAPIYMGLVPRDPSSVAASVDCTGAAADLVGCDYAYNLAAAGDYDIFFELEGATGGLNIGPHCASQNGISNNAAPAVCP